MTTSPIAQLVALTLVLTAPLAAQVAEAPDRQYFISGHRLERSETSPSGWQAMTPLMDHAIGLPQGWAPGQFMDMYGGQLLLDATLYGQTGPTSPGNPYTIGYALYPVFEFSPGQAWSNFGQSYPVPGGVKSISTPFAGGPPALGVQYQHIDDLNMWKMIGGDWTDPSAWCNAPNHGANFPSPLLPPGALFDVFKHDSRIQSAVAAAAPAGLGELVGINAVIQVGTLTNPTPGCGLTPEIDLSNAIGLTLLPGPSIKINVGTGGNFGPAGFPMLIGATNFTPSLTPYFPNGSGGFIRGSITPISGVAGVAVVPPASRSGLMQFTANTGTPSTAPRPPIFIRTVGTPINGFTNASPLPNLHAEPVGANTAIFGFSLLATVTPAGLTLPMTLPTAAALAGTGTLVIEVFRHDATTNQAGHPLNAAPGVTTPLPVNITVTATSLGGPTASGTAPIGNQIDGVRNTVVNTSQDQTVTISSTNTQAQQVLVNLYWTP